MGSFGGLGGLKYPGGLPGLGSGLIGCRLIGCGLIPGGFAAGGSGCTIGIGYAPFSGGCGLIGCGLIPGSLPRPALPNHGGRFGLFPARLGSSPLSGNPGYARLGGPNSSGGSAPPPSSGRGLIGVNRGIRLGSSAPGTTGPLGPPGLISPYFGGRIKLGSSRGSLYSMH